MTNITNKFLLEKIGGTDASSYIGKLGEVFYDPSVGNLRKSDGVTPGGLPFESFSTARPVIASFGDSMTAQGSRNIQPPSSTPSRAYYTDGYMSWFRVLANQRFIHRPEHNFGVSGDTFQMMMDRIDDVIAVSPDYCVVLGGANNFASDTFETIVAAWLEIVVKLRRSGIIVVVMPAPPRSGTFLTIAQVHLQLRFTEFQREYCRLQSGMIFVDYLGYLTDQTSVVSAAISGMLKTDNLHQAAIGAYYMGLGLKESLDRYLPPASTGFVSAADYYSADNPSGSLLYSGTANRSLLTGTTGTKTASTGLTYAGAGCATGSTFIRSSATSTCTVTLDKESPRLDGRNSGERQLIDIACSSGGGATEVYNFRFTPTLADVSAGDWYYAQAMIEILVAPVNVYTVELYLLETRPTNSQTAIDLSLRDTGAALLPSVLWEGILRTPPIQRTSDATALQLNVRIQMKTNTGAASVKLAVGDMILRKISSEFAI
jgi:hypothetical protein